MLSVLVVLPEVKVLNASFIQEEKRDYVDLAEIVSWQHFAFLSQSQDYINVSEPLNGSIKD